MGNSWKKDYLRYKDFFLNVLVLYNTKPNIKIYLELILSIVTIIIFSFFAIRPTVITIIALNKEIKTKEEISQKLKSKVKNLQAIGTLLQQKSADVMVIKEAVPENSSPDKLVNQLENISKNNSLNITNFSISDTVIYGIPPKSKKTREYKSLSEEANELAFIFSATGSYQNIYNFLAQIEDMRRPIKIDTMTISSGSNEEDEFIVITIAGRLPFLLKSNVVEIK